MKNNYQVDYLEPALYDLQEIVQYISKESLLIIGLRTLCRRLVLE